MPISILLVCFIIIACNVALYANYSSKREQLIYSILIFSVLLFAVTEILSAFNAVSFGGIFISWLLVSISGIGNLLVNRALLHAKIIAYQHQLSYNWGRLSVIQKVVILFVFSLLLLVFIQGLIYPPNNWDSMTYHMGRIASWIAHGNVDFYPTAILRQLYQPPFAEYVILHFGLLSFTDYFSNAVQFIFMAGCIIIVTTVIRELGLNRYYQLLGAVLVATIPEALLQASSTQNDVILSFFITTSFYFVLKLLKKSKIEYYIFFGTSIGLALLTKGTAYIYAAPIIILFAAIALRMLMAQRAGSFIKGGLIAAFIILLINCFAYTRNYQLTGNLLGVDTRESQMYANEQMSPLLLLSSVVKNSSLHLSISHTGSLATHIDQFVKKLHNTIGVDINDKAVNYYSMPFTSQSAPTFEDTAPNPLHYILIALSLIILPFFFIKRQYRTGVVLLYFIVVMQILLFCGYLKWQPWHSRLHTPIFILGAILVSYAFSLLKSYRKILYLIVPALLLYAIAVIIFNHTRPYRVYATITKNISPSSTRLEKYFSPRPELYNDYKNINEAIENLNVRNIGLLTGQDDWVYPLFTNCFASSLVPIYLEVGNFSKKAAQTMLQPDVIVTFKPMKDNIIYNNILFYKQTNFAHINLYTQKR